TSSACRLSSDGQAMSFHRTDGLVRELIARYKPSVLWNDIAWPSEDNLQALLVDYYAAVPDGVVNDRWMASRAIFEAMRTPEARQGFNAMVKARMAAE